MCLQVAGRRCISVDVVVVSILPYSRAVESNNIWLLPQCFPHIAQRAEIPIELLQVRVRVLGQEPGIDDGRRSTVTRATMNIHFLPQSLVLGDKLYSFFNVLYGWFKVIRCRQVQVPHPQLLVSATGASILFTKVYDAPHLKYS
jgi:hypothetical protein